NGIVETMEGTGGRLIDRLVEGVEVRSRMARRFAHDISGLAWMTAQQQKMAAAVAAQHWADIAFGRGAMSAARMADMGIDEAMSLRIVGQLRQHAVTMDGSTLRSMRVDQWADDEAAAAF